MLKFARGRLHRLRTDFERISIAFSQVTVLFSMCDLAHWNPCRRERGRKFV